MGVGRAGEQMGWGFFLVGGTSSTILPGTPFRAPAVSLGAKRGPDLSERTLGAHTQV